MPGNRQVKKGSFGGHFDELVTHFPERATEQREQLHKRSSSLQERIDIHALLFQRAWEVDSDRNNGGGI